MLRDFKFLRRNSGKRGEEEMENLPLNSSKDSWASQSSSTTDPARPPLNTIQEPKVEHEAVGPAGGGTAKTRIDRTPTKPKKSDSMLPLRTPEKHGGGAPARYRSGWAQNEEAVGRIESYRGGLPSVTPRSMRTTGRAASSSCYSEANSTQSTPTKSVSKPPSSGVRGKVVEGSNGGGGRMGNFAALYRGIPVSGALSSTVVNTVEVPHFDLKEDPSFWMDHSVQVLIRVRPPNGMEKSSYGYNRCLKQESAQSITWIGQPETRFTFDHVACETVDQEMLFRMAGLPMVENCLSGYNSCMFAYGQTGSGKTYTMLGEIDDLEVKPSPHRGMTPRIFEFLFARIQAEEESRRDERLTYNCKCSFLEIYNEQITDLLDPSSTNLLLREDVKKGVYVENLSEYEVQNVSDILKLLMQGSLNRRVAATNMNRESSRSHSVFTCVIESRWEKDSTTNLRFARLNLVDLAGSERQKSSGAEGERLKEAANINKSLSTLGHVIMILVDIAHGKPRHVPYRDSRLTFLLQDSLGGNSKTMIIANVSPSLGSAAETLNTLKFAQRAKQIQNNAVVNEDSTGDVIALQHQIRLLKEELSLLKRQNVFRSLSFGSDMKNNMLVQDNSCTENLSDMDDQEDDDLIGFESKGIIRLSTKQLKSLETTLAGALRREQMADTSIKKLEAEIEHLNRLVRQREEDTRSTKMMLKFREDKIQRMESVLGGSLPADSYLLEENKALHEEIQLLKTKVDKNPEVTRFALENIRLLDQLRRYQEFYEEGEREILLDEVSKLREQMLQLLDGKSVLHHSNAVEQSQEAACTNQQHGSLHLELKKTLSELEEYRRNLNSCLEENSKLSREIHNLHHMLNEVKSAPNCLDGNFAAVKDLSGAPTSDFGMPRPVNDDVEAPSTVTHTEEILDLQLELDILKIILKEERTSRGEVEETKMCLSIDLGLTKEQLNDLRQQYEDASRKLKEAKSVIDALESQQLLAINEVEDLKKSTVHHVKRLDEKEFELMTLKEKLSLMELRDLPSIKSDDEEDSTLQRKLKRMKDSLETAKRLNMWYQNDRACQESNENEMDEVRRQAEAETAEVIVCMQEELSSLQQQVQDHHLKEMETENTWMLMETELKDLQEKLHLLTEHNKLLQERLDTKDEELENLSEEWELLACEMEQVLADGQEALSDASNQLGLISSFTHQRIWISEQVSRLIRIISEKELLIEELGKCLEDANSKRSEVDGMLKSLRGAALVMTETHQQECAEKEKEILLLRSHLKAKTATVAELEGKVKEANHHARNASACATVAFVIVNRLSEVNLGNLNELKYKDMQLCKSAEIGQRKEALLNDQAAAVKEAEEESQSLRIEVTELKERCTELQKRLFEEENRACAVEQKLNAIEENDILMTKEKIRELKAGVSTIQSCMSIHKAHHGAETNEAHGDCVDVGESRWTDATEDLSADISESCLNLGNDLSDSLSEPKDKKFRRNSNNAHNRDTPITLLRKELESALESLHEVQMEMAKLRDENEHIRVSEKQNLESMKVFAAEILSLQEVISNFESQFQLKIQATDNKLCAFEQTVQEVGNCWFQTKEYLEMEVGDANIVAVQKAAEASCILAKFEEAQYTMKEADIMINELMIANETMKLDMQRAKEMEISLTNERDGLLSEVQKLHSINHLKDQQFVDLERQFSSNLMETRNLVSELEGIIVQVQTTFNQNFMEMVTDFSCMRTLISKSGKLVRSWLEDVWSEIVGKDCAISVLHLCHMGIMLETVTGLNAENGLLQHGLCESNSVIADLRERNSKSSRELQICRTLKGKLLADIKNSFDRVSRKEEETGDLGVKLSTFEKKIFDLQLQEELMLQRSNYMGSQLAILIKQLEWTNSDMVQSLLDQEKVLKDKEEILTCEAELLILEFLSKDFESFVLASQLQEMTFQRAVAVKDLEKLKEDFILLMIDGNLNEQVLVAKEAEIDLVQENFELLKDASCSNNMLKSELGQAVEMKMKLLSQVQALETECEKLLKDLKIKETALENSSNYISSLDQQNQKLEKDICLLETSSSKLQMELDLKDAELGRMISLEEENKSLKSEVCSLKTDNSQVLQDLKKKTSEVELSQSHIDLSDKENSRLKDCIQSLESLVVSLQAGLEKKDAEVNELLQSQSIIMKDLCSKSQDLQVVEGKLTELKGESILLRNEVRSHEQKLHEALDKSRLDTMSCVHSAESINSRACRLLQVLEKESFVNLDKSFHDICGNMEKTAEFMKEIEALESLAEELESENKSLQAELLRKDDILKGLSFDLSLLQESASNSKDQKDKIEELVASLDALEDELLLKSGDLDEAIAHSEMLEAQLQEKLDMISTLQPDLDKQRESLKMSSCENGELKAQIHEALIAKCSLEEELLESRNLTERLEMELSQMGGSLGQMNDTIESLTSNLNEITSERDHLDMKTHSLKEELEKARAWAKENEAVALEAEQIAEARKIYAEEKEAEVKLLERSVEELECTINVLENKVDILKGEAERQRLQREELEAEVHSVNHQMQNLKSADTDMKRHLEEKEKGLEKTLKRIQILERDIANKDAEIAQCQMYISELNLHAEAQASEYKQKFKELEAMAEQVKPEGNFLSHGTSSFYKSEKIAAKSRGSGSPFKCIGLGMAQQMKSEKDEELTAARLRIEELESLAASRQKDIFALNARLAATESMTHDVIRDLLGVKLDMTNYVTLLDNKQVQKIAEKAQLNNLEPQQKEEEVLKLKKQLTEFIEERRAWLEEIDRKQAEMVAAQVALENLRQRDQLLKTENEMLKMENVNHKKRVMELEGEVNKLSGQQNLQQRIHHHAKVKEENNALKTQNEELSGKLRRAENMLSRVKEELANYRASTGRFSYVNFDEEQHLMNKLKETEDDRVQLAQKLLGLSISILKAAGITKPVSDITPAVAEEALEQLKCRITSLERQLQDLALKNRISAERIRLSELMPQASPTATRADENCQTPRRIQAPFLSALDR